MNNARYARCLATSRREFDFWAEMIATPTRARTRAQRRHVQTRQKRGRLLALEVLTKMNRKLRKMPIGIRDLDTQDLLRVSVRWRDEGAVILDEAHRTKLGAVT